MNVYDEVRWNDFSFVLADILRAKLHLARLDIVTSLNKCRIEHDAEHGLVREACVLEDDLDVAFQHETLLLLLSQQKDHTILFLAVLLLRWVGESFPNVKPTAAVDFEKRYAPTATHVGNLDELDASEALCCWRLDLVPEESLKVVQVAQLARLTDSFSASEAHLAVVLEALVNIVQEAHEKEDGTDGSPCATLSRVAVH